MATTDHEWIEPRGYVLDAERAERKEQVITEKFYGGRTDGRRDDGTYEIERLLRMRCHGGKRRWLVRWLGWDRCWRAFGSRVRSTERHARSSRKVSGKSRMKSSAQQRLLFRICEYWPRQFAVFILKLKKSVSVITSL